MFKKLRNRFLLLNLVTLSVMMLMAFAAIYIITYSDVRSDIDMELHKISDSGNGRPMNNPGPQRPDFSDGQRQPERSVAFTVYTDSQWNVLAVSSVFGMDDDFYEAAVNSVRSKSAATGYFKLNGSSWSYMSRPQPAGYQVVFLDTTSRQEILTNLVYTFLIVALIMLIFIYLISRIFANKAIKPVEEAFDKQKQFIADASHELKTPLAVINTNVDVLLSNGEDLAQAQSKWLHYIKSEAERMAKLTNDLLYLTQLDYTDVKMVFTNFNMSEKVENIILAMEAVIYERALSFEHRIEPGLLIHGNSEQIQQLVMILLDNAVKYANPSGKISISLKKHHNTAVLAVTNTGDGISEEHIGRIYDRFYRPDKSRARKSGGYGLGLAIAKKITEQHGGKIHVRSITNESTTFTVELPVN